MRTSASKQRVILCPVNTGFWDLPLSDEKYSLLRSWYLAHLRKGAMDEQRKMQLTPAALIAADKESVMKLAEEKAGKLPSAPALSSAAIWKQLLVAWLICVAVSWLTLLINSGMAVSESFAQLHGLTIGLFDRHAARPEPAAFLLITVFFYGLPLAAAFNAAVRH